MVHIYIIITGRCLTVMRLHADYENIYEEYCYLSAASNTRQTAYVM